MEFSNQFNLPGLKKPKSSSSHIMTKVLCLETNWVGVIRSRAILKTAQQWMKRVNTESGTGNGYWWCVSFSKLMLLSLTFGCLLMFNLTFMFYNTWKEIHVSRVIRYFVDMKDANCPEPYLAIWWSRSWKIWWRMPSGIHMEDGGEAIGSGCSTATSGVRWWILRSTVTWCRRGGGIEK